MIVIAFPPQKSAQPLCWYNSPYEIRKYQCGIVASVVMFIQNFIKIQHFIRRFLKEPTHRLTENRYWNKTIFLYKVRKEFSYKRLLKLKNFFEQLANNTYNNLRRKCILKHVTEGKIEGTVRRGRRRKQLLDNIKETRRYWKLIEDALDSTLCRTRFGRGYGPVVRQFL